MSNRKRLDEVATSLYIHGRMSKFFESIGLDPWSKSENLFEHLVRSPVSLEKFIKHRECILADVENLKKENTWPQKKVG